MIDNKTPAMFVYVRGLKGPAPELWPEPLPDMSGKERPYLAKYELTEEESKLSLDQLKAKYPPPVMGEGA
jgi:hypothetical protein